MKNKRDWRLCIKFEDGSRKIFDLNGNIIEAFGNAKIRKYLNEENGISGVFIIDGGEIPGSSFYEEVDYIEARLDDVLYLGGGIDF